MKTQKQRLEELAGCHVLVYAGNGQGQPAELLFETSSAKESDAIRDLLLKLLRERKGDNGGE